MKKPCDKTRKNKGSHNSLILMFFLGVSISVFIILVLGELHAAPWCFGNPIYLGDMCLDFVERVKEVRRNAQLCFLPDRSPANYSRRIDSNMRNDIFKVARKLSDGIVRTDQSNPSSTPQKIQVFTISALPLMLLFLLKALRCPELPSASKT